MEQKNELNRRSGRWLKRLALLILGLLIFFSGLVMFISIPAVQKRIVSRLSKSLSNQLGARVGLESVSLGLTGKIKIDGFFLEDQQGETLANLGRLEVKVSMTGLLRHKVDIGSLKLTNSIIKINRDRDGPDYNFSFLLKAFEGSDETTQKKQWEISLNKIQIDAIDFSFDDKLSNIYLYTNFASLKLDVDDLDLTNPISADIKTISLSGLRSGLEYGTPLYPASNSPRVKEGSDNRLPDISLSNLNLQDCKFELLNRDNGEKWDFGLMTVAIHLDKIDLSNKYISASSLAISSPEVRGNLPDIQAIESSKAVLPNEGSKQEFFLSRNSWHIASDRIQITQGSFSYDDQHKARQKGIDPAHLDLSGINLDAYDTGYLNDTIMLNAGSLGIEKTGLGHALNFSGELSVLPKQMKVQGLKVSFGASAFSIDGHSNYTSYEEAISSPGDIFFSEFRLKTDFNLRELKDILPVLGKIDPFSDKAVKLELAATGKIDRLILHNLEMNSPGLIQLRGKGSINSLLTPANLSGSVKIDTLIASKNSILPLLPDSLLNSINLPEFFALKLNAEGSAKKISGTLNFVSDALRLDTDIPYLKLFNNDLDIKLENLLLCAELDKILVEAGGLGVLECEGRLEVSSILSDERKAGLDLDIQELGYGNYIFSEILLSTKLLRDTIDAAISVRDPGLSASLEGRATLGKKNVGIQVSGVIDTLNDLAIKLPSGLTNLSSSFEIEAFIDSSNNILADASLRSISAMISGQQLQLDSLIVSAQVSDNATKFSLLSEPLILDFESDIPASGLSDALIGHIGRYMVLPGMEPKPIPAEGRMSLDLLLDFNRLFPEIAASEAQDLQAFSMKAVLDLESEKLSVKAESEGFRYASISLDSLQLTIESDKEKLDYSIDLKRTDYGKLSLGPSSLAGVLEQNNWRSQIAFSHVDGGHRMLLQNDILFRDSSFFLDFSKGKLMLNDSTWTVNADSYFQLSLDGKVDGSLHFKKGDSQIDFSHDKGKMKVSTKDLSLEDLFSFLEYDTYENPLQGYLNMALDLENKDQKNLIKGDMALRDIYFTGDRLGNLDNEIALTGSELLLDGKWFDTEHDVLFELQYDLADSLQNIDITLDLERLSFDKAKPWLPKEVKNLEGSLKGQLAVSGTLKEPILSGNLNFSKTQFDITPLNSTFRMGEQPIKINNNLLNINRLTILDNFNDTLVVKGTLFARNINMIETDLHIGSRKFHFFNNSKENSPLLYGTLLASVDIDVEGTNNNPVVTAGLKVLENSELFIKLPEKELRLEELDGIVEFTGTDSSGIDSIQSGLGRSIEDSLNTYLKGLNLQARLNVNENAAITIYTNPNTKDKLKVRGRGDLFYSIRNESSGSLTGYYEITDGSYDLSFYNLVNKHFKFVAGSRVDWSGDIENPRLDVKAVHSLEAAPLNLIVGTNSQLDESERVKLQEKIPFEVQLSIEGPVRDPELSFGLDASQDAKAKNRSLANKLIMLKEDGREGELNEQVFSLLVLGFFIPVESNSGNSAFNSSKAIRNTVTSLMTDQLNNFLGKYVKRVDLQLGVESKAALENGVEKDQTELELDLSKSLLDGRIKVTVSSSYLVTQDELQNTTGSGFSDFKSDIWIDYNILKNGNYKVKAFSVHDYDVFEGDIRSTGGAFIFEKEFNRLRRKKTKEGL